jgi:hypothetical protein
MPNRHWPCRTRNGGCRLQVTRLESRKPRPAADCRLRARGPRGWVSQASITTIAVLTLVPRSLNVPAGKCVVSLFVAAR